jgi:deoxycytidine triphosphate deaminase
MAAAPVLPDFASTDLIAAARFEMWRDRDPFPTIQPTLLNSADLLDYVATVGMLSPYSVTPDTRDLLVKPASCAVACTGDVFRFGFDREKQAIVEKARHRLEPGTALVLPANSITYLQLGTPFRIPDYIAARFNLAIREIHRGFLVGTGPLVDPGFVGRLFVPLHNLTSNEYRIWRGEPFVWVEFTKLSPNAKWENPRPQKQAAEFVPFPERKLKRQTPADYLRHANDGRPIASSIPEQFERTRAVAERAEGQVRLLRNAGIVAVVLGALAAVLPMINLVSDTNARIDALETDRNAVYEQLRSLKAVSARQGEQFRRTNRTILRRRDR